MALGRRGERDLGVTTIPIGSVVGTVDRRPDSFDRSFRPRSPELRARWEGIAAARRRGEELPPIDVYRVGDLHFVIDGHHRVSVARAMGDTTIEARVREVATAVHADSELRAGDLGLKRHERMFHERVPLPPACASGSCFSDEWRYAQLAASSSHGASGPATPASSCSAASRRRSCGSRRSTSPSSPCSSEADVGGEGTEAERYLRVALLRYLLLYTNDWSDDVAERLLGEVRPPSGGDDTMVHEILKEMR